MHKAVAGHTPEIRLASFAVPSVLYATMHFVAYLLVLSMMLMRKHFASSMQHDQSARQACLGSLEKWFEDIRIPGGYMSIEHRNDKANFIDNLNTIPTYNLNHPNGVRTNWLHHTFPNEIFNDANHVKKSKRAIEKLLWKGLSKLKDTVLTLVSGHRPFDFESVQHYLISTKQLDY